MFEGGKGTLQRKIYLKRLFQWSVKCVMLIRKSKKKKKDFFKMPTPQLEGSLAKFEKIFVRRLRANGKNNRDPILPHDVKTMEWLYSAIPLEIIVNRVKKIALSEHKVNASKRVT